MAVRFATTFLVEWLRIALQTRYVRHLQTDAFGSALRAEVSYFDEEGSDDILNAIVGNPESRLYRPTSPSSGASRISTRHPM
ncbi:hypothetical protein [Natronococcus jeotgali]|uniref:ABC-type multidrug/lipid transport system,permease and ATP-binding protein n=1 Tax=Natronococcus jeotgali DSM 18795 TaxID=1227498 RepID=L9X1S3_9EURY|nr:hypothetical protein [Natronococcus jeotgali]ELY55680.1 ABC-type multidrug/lipid transport system,permease and ATP-binding protein [Natronococcus jeotgali DSM 18795]